MFPATVASTGPAATGAPAASAADWQRTALRAPPPTMWIVSSGARPAPGMASRAQR